MNKIKHFAPLILLLSAYSCQSFFMHMTGIKQPHPVTNGEILASAKDFGIELENIYKIDTLAYKHYADSIRKGDSLTFKNIMQPLQIKFFPSDKNISFYLVNCSVGGLPNLKWNRLHSFNTYPPSMFYFNEINYRKTLSSDTLFYIPLKRGLVNEKPEATVVVFWSRMMGKQSRILIQEALHYRERFKDHLINLLFVNNDNLYQQE
jgi:hypothetical protein